MSELTALKAALAAEQAISYGYGVVGAHLSGAPRRYAAQRLLTHQRRADRLSSLITALGAVPPAALPAYRLPIVVDGATTARRLAAHLEDGATGAAWDLAAATAAASPARREAVNWLTDAAVSTAHWGAAPTVLPGKP